MKDARSAEDDFLARAEILIDPGSARRQPGDEKAFADLLLARMRETGLLSAAVPPEFGGPGLGLGAVARITERIARHSGSAGLIYAMHMSQVFSVVRHGSGAFFAALQERMVREQILIASGTSEKGPGGDIFTSLARVTPGPDGRLAGVKESPNISYLDQAGLILLTANMAADAAGNPGGGDRQVLIALDMKDVQVEAPHRAGFLGMRGIVNQPARLTFSAPPEAVFPTPFAPIARRSMTPCIHVLWAAMWSGIAWGAIDKARTFLRQEIAAGGEAEALARHALSRIVNRHATLNALVRAAIQACESDPTRGDIGLGAAARINRLKITGSELLVEICLEALKLIGIRAYAAGGPYSLAEAMADALSAPVMVSNTRLQMNTAAVEGFAEEAL